MIECIHWQISLGKRARSKLPVFQIWFLESKFLAKWSHFFEQQLLFHLFFQKAVTRTLLKSSKLKQQKVVSVFLQVSSIKVWRLPIQKKSFLYFFGENTDSFEKRRFFVVFYFNGRDLCCLILKVENRAKYIWKR